MAVKWVEVHLLHTINSWSQFFETIAEVARG